MLEDGINITSPLISKHIDLRFDDDDESNSKRRRGSATVINDDEQLQDLENGKVAAITGAAMSILKPTPAIYYLAGGGKSDCSRERRSPYMVNGIDVSDLLWDYRWKILERAERMEPLESVERL